MSDSTSFKGVTNIGQPLLSDILETNLWSFFSWATLGIGGFSNVDMPASGVYGGDRARLRRATDPNYTDGQVYEGFRQDWVWETGIENSNQPIRVSGVFVNGTFHDINETGVYAHKVDYPKGRVIFNSPISSTARVTCNYSYRTVSYSTSDAPWWKQVQFDSLRVDDFQFLQTGSGSWSKLGRNRLQLPAVVIEAVPNTSRVGLEVGSSAAIVKQDVLFHVLTETPWERKQLHDLITYQWQKRLVLFDKNALLSQNKFPLDGDGSPVPSGLMYPDLIKPTGEGGFGWRQLRIMDFRSSSQPREVTAPLYYATVRSSCEIDMP